MSGLLFEKPLRSSRAFDIISRDIKKGIGHAYMIVSQDEEALEEFVTLFSCAVYCKDNSACFSCPECLKVLHGNHEDIINFRPVKKQFKADQLDAFLDEIHLKSYSGRKLCILHKADLMSNLLQNKLLKSLEEPPQEVTLILPVTNESQMIETIKSRANIIHIDLFDRDTIMASLAELGCDEKTAAIAAECSEGLLGKAHAIAKSPSYISQYETAVKLLTDLNRSSDILKLSPLVSSQDDMQEFLNVLSIVIHELMLDKAENPGTENLKTKFSKRALAEILQKINEERKKLSILPQKTIGGSVADNLLFFILEAKHKWQS